MSDEIHYKIIKLIEENPNISQRELAKALGVSLGKANYCLKAIMEVGLIKLKNFRNNENKLSYAYILTPKGIEQKAAITTRFLKSKQKEYDELKKEIEILERDLAKDELPSAEQETD
ncbi:MarR family EPS-associated transcriptional regulator [Solemya elarraichensis gill symbiont]|uniref:MarR family EPS-associated transcriptional regulator n=1 Tax=Solemya elarraichensis gill symbiont TaxID=1918949 RepID=A0A1T2L1D0_9GAMM|nr:MarR family EPS-associated transcriptional regulator [Solemya elarraichensis gill symbiont]